MSRNKKFFVKHAKSGAALISLGIHAALVVVALSFVAVTVITKEEQKFEAKPVPGRDGEKFKMLTNYCKGEMSVIKGMAIQSYVPSGGK